jgi:hypothetical protein
MLVLKALMNKLYIKRKLSSFAERDTIKRICILEDTM